MSEGLTLERRVERLEKENKDMKVQIAMLQAEVGLSTTSQTQSEWKRNTVSDWMIKIVYPGIYSQKGQPTAGFPVNRRRTAAQVKPGQQMFVYATAPVKKIIGLAEVVDAMVTIEHSRWPFSVPLRWMIGPKQKGVTIDECGLDIRPRPGDTVYGITEDVAERIIELLNDQKDLTKDQWDLLDAQYRDMYRESVTHAEAVRRLREVGEHQAANELEDFRATDGTRRGWDEFASQDQFYEKYPGARSIIWPDEYQD